MWNDLQSPDNAEDNQKILIVVPAYNEELSLPIVVDDLRKHGPNADILVVDDGSSDKTAETALSLGCMLVSLPFNLGIGGAVQTGLIYAVRDGYDYVLQFDGDGQHMACEIDKLLQPVSKGEADIVVGSRFLNTGGFKSSLMRRAGISIFRGLISSIIHQKITDCTSGFRAYNSKAAHYLASDYPCDYPEVEAIVLLARRGFKLREVPVFMRQRQAGHSSITTLHGAYYMIKVILAVMVDLLRSKNTHIKDIEGDSCR